MPGFNYCLGGMDVTLNDLENPAPRSKIRVDSDVLELKEGDKFIDGRCTIRDIKTWGINQYVEISCREDDESSRFSLSISPKINLSIGGTTKEYSVGERLFSNDEYHVYLGFVGNTETTHSIDKLYARFIGIPITKRAESQVEKLTDSEITYMAEYDRSTAQSDLELGAEEKVAAIAKSFSSKLGGLTRQFITGNNLEDTKYSTPDKKIFGETIRIMGYSGAYDSDLDLLPAAARNNYTNAMEDYETVVEGFGSEIWPESKAITLGEEALSKAINLASSFGQREKAKDLCEDFSETYTNSPAPEICTNEYLRANTEVSGQSVLVNGQTHIISFEGNREPRQDEFSLRIKVTYPDGSSNITTLTLEETFYINSTANEYIQLVGLEEDSANLRVLVDREGLNRPRTTEQKLDINREENFGSKYYFSIQEINLKKAAKVTLNPQVDYARTNATFSFRIGIEKRGIQLSPEKTREKMESLNKKIETLEKINNRLSSVVETGKKACLGVSGFMLAKNFVANLGGKGIARQKVMRGDSGWYDFCQQQVNAQVYDDIEQCLLQNNDNIEAEVKIVNDQLKAQNERTKQLEDGISKTSFLGETVVNTDKLTERFILDSKTEFNSCASSGQVTLAGGGTVNKAEIATMISENTTSLTQARDLQLYCRLLGSGGVTGEMAQKQVDKIL